MKKLLLILTHLVALAIGFAAGIYALPLLTAPPAPARSELVATSEEALFTGTFRRDLAGSDFLHWGEGTVYVHADRVGLDGSLAPGPDYRLYFSPSFVETEAEFEALKSAMVDAGPVRTFTGFLVPLPEGLDPAAYDTVVVWCESFGEFITAARYR